MYDILISGGKLVDGTGAPWRYADIGITGERITAVGRLADPAHKCIDAAGQIVCPGFIDMHSHADISLLADKWVDLRLLQGITTEVVGQDGLSYAPASPVHLDEWRRYLIGLNGDFPGISWDWQSVADLLDRYQNRAANVVFMIPHGAVRVEVVGWAPRPATGPEMSAMQDLVNRGMAQGASGISTGLSYIPCNHATTQEMIALCEPVAEAGGILSVHMRSYIGELAQALDEIIEIGRTSGVAVQISHLRMCDPLVWGRSGEVLNKLDRAREAGVDITFDSYPYTIGSAPLFAMLPPWAQEGGPDAILSRLQNLQDRNKIIQEMLAWATDWPSFFLTNARVTELGDFAGSSLSDAAKSLGMNTPEFILTLLVETELDATILADGGNTADNDIMLAHPTAMICSDGILIGQKPHPRGYGTFPRVLDQYVRQKKILSWETAIQKMTGMPAVRLNLQDRGFIREGAFADIVVLTPGEIADHATVRDGRAPATGVNWVLVNGRIVVDNYRFVEGNYGKAIKLCN